MHFGRVLVGIALVGVVALAALLSYLNAQEIPAEELQRRCNESRPAWVNYHEDLKGQVGAAPVARWEGRPVRIERVASELRVVFSLDPPWADYEAALPVLLRDPLGNVCHPASTRRDGGERIYVFQSGGLSEDAGLPWVELRYPHGETRHSLSADGRWEVQGE